MLKLINQFYLYNNYLSKIENQDIKYRIIIKNNYIKNINVYLYDLYSLFQIIYKL